MKRWLAQVSNIRSMMLMFTVCMLIYPSWVSYSIYQTKQDMKQAVISYVTAHCDSVSEQLVREPDFKMEVTQMKFSPLLYWFSDQKMSWSAKANIETGQLGGLRHNYYMTFDQTKACEIVANPLVKNEQINKTISQPALIERYTELRWNGRYSAVLHSLILTILIGVNVALWKWHRWSKRKVGEIDAIVK